MALAHFSTLKEDLQRALAQVKAIQEQQQKGDGVIISLQTLA
ncbi:hypothetical protein HAL07_11080 [Helicobacter ailurogastricus]|uniref:Uncharacterized protein n=1 Tax=Helicobacter ailurogastricus TaxID=1578720 RepID=A0A0K2Y132_9HELI|nr:hypothetical protein HAL07_11080 [Helicobacter ailurogastricus]